MKSIHTVFLHIFRKIHPIVYVFFVWFIFCSPYFFQGKVPYPSKYQVTFFGPWSSYEQWWGPVKNNAMPDVIDQIYPWKFFTIHWMKFGQVPLWNPNSFAGNPHVGNFQSAVFSPFNLLFFLLPFIDAWSILILLQPLLAGIFTYVYMRQIKVHAIGALAGAVTFMFSGFMVTWMAYGTLAMAIAFLPLCLYAVEKYYASKKIQWLGIFATGIVVSFFSGHFQTSFYLLLYVSAYLLFKFLTMKDMQKFLWTLVFLCVGLGISLLQIYPTLTLYGNSVRSSLAHVGGGISIDYLPTVFAPDFFGNPVTRNDWRGNYAEWASFIGIIPLMLSFYALYKKKEYAVRFFFVAGIAALALSLETPLHDVLIATQIPVLATSIPSRIIILFSFSFAILSGIGMGYIFQKLHTFSLRKVVFPLLVSGLILAGSLIAVYFLAPFTADKKILALKNTIIPGILFVSFSCIILFIAFAKKRLLIPYVTYSFLLLLSLDSYRFAVKWMPFDGRDLVYPNVPVISAMQQKIGFGRVFGNLGNQVESYYGLPSLEGYDPLYIQRYGEFIMYGVENKFVPAQRSVARLDRRSENTDRILDLLGVNIIYQPKADTYQEWAYPVWNRDDRYERIYEDDKFQLYKNKQALPRVKLYTTYEVITEEEKILQRFYDGTFDFRNILLLEDKPSFASSRDISRKNTSQILSYTPNKIEIAVNAERPALLFLSDNFYENWHAMVNGKVTRIYRANYSFRAIEVPRGESKVVFFYELL